jgi:type I restriction enzyme S subunit
LTGLVQQDDLLVTITGANLTRSAHVVEDIDDAYVNQHIALVRPAAPETAAYLHLWLISPAHGRKTLLTDSYGAGRPGLNLTNIRQVPVALPPLAGQHEIVERVWQLMAMVDQVEERLSDAALACSRSTQARLARAFNETREKAAD